MRAIAAGALALLAGLVARQCFAAAVKGPPSPLPAVPLPSWNEPSSAPPAIVLTNEVGDSVVIEQTLLRRQVDYGRMAITSPRSRWSAKLADGSTLRVDERTAAGGYANSDGDSIWVMPGISYPRYIQAPRGVTWDVTFSVRNAVRVGVLVASSSGTPLPSTYLEQLSGARRSWTVDREDSIFAIECSEDGPTRGTIALDPSRSLPVAVTWFAYRGDPVAAHASSSAVRRAGNHVEWHAEWAVPAKPYPLALNQRLGFGEPRFVGTILIDPTTKTITPAP